MNEEYLKGRILAGLPIMIDNIPIYSPTLLDIFDIGEIQYEHHINRCIISKDNVEGEFDDISNFDVLISFLAIDKMNTEDFLNSLNFFTGLNFNTIRDDNSDYHFVAETLDGYVILNRKNYDTFINYVKFANLIEIKKTIQKKTEFEKHIEKAKKRLEERLKKKGIKLKKNNEDDITLIDLISVLSSCHNSLNLLNVWELNIFSFQDQFKRTQLIESYDIGIRQLLAGAKQEDVKLKHYIQKI